MCFTLGIGPFKGFFDDTGLDLSPFQDFFYDSHLIEMNEVAHRIPSIHVMMRG